MIDKQNINSTFERIEKSLDLRFQKKGTLFISKNDLEVAKKSIYKGEYQNFFALGSKVGMPVLMQVILKNPWIVDDKTLQNREFKKQLNVILEENGGKQYLPHLRKIAKDEVFSTIAFKKYSEEKYYRKINADNCREVYEDQRKKPAIRALCFSRAIMSSDESGSYKIRQIDEMFMFDTDIYKEAKDKPYLNEIVQNMSEQEDVAEWILDNKCQDKMETVWSSAFMALKENAFVAALEHIRLNMDYDNFTTKWLLRKAIPRLFLYAKGNEDLTDRYVESLVDLYRTREAYRIKVLFLDMLEPSKFKDKELALRLLDQYENIGISEKFEHRVENIRQWEDSSIGYKSAREIYEDLSNGQDLTQKGTLNYIAMQFKKTDFIVIEELYEVYSESANVTKAISYFIAKEMKNGGNQLLNRFNSLSDEYIGQIVEFIEEYLINTAVSQEFLNRVGRHDILAKFMRR